jgi:hypothetical protein
MLASCKPALELGPHFRSHAVANGILQPHLLVHLIRGCIDQVASQFTNVLTGVGFVSGTRCDKSLTEIAR